MAQKYAPFSFLFFTRIYILLRVIEDYKGRPRKKSSCFLHEVLGLDES